MAQQQLIVVLPQNATFDYLAEGAANVVCRVSIPGLGIGGANSTLPPALNGALPQDPFAGKLVRFRKNVSTTAPCSVALADWERLVKPLFPDYELIDQALVDLRPSNIIAKLNNDLRSWEFYQYPFQGTLRSIDPRPTKRRGNYLADDDYALLITDMTPVGNQTVLEFKCKWLVQSPSAPWGSTRCRTCAKMARLNAEHARNGLPPALFYCPLDLTSKDPQDLMHVATIMLQPDASSREIVRLAQWLQTTDVVASIKDYQIAFDPVGVIAGTADDEKLLLAMTLRDCSVYVRSAPDQHPVTWEARIGDLDLKSGDKLAYWRSVEKSLIDEGWYMGEEAEENRQPNYCHLNPARSLPLVRPNTI